MSVFGRFLLRRLFGRTVGRILHPPKREPATHETAALTTDAQGLGAIGKAMLGEKVTEEEIEELSPKAQAILRAVAKASAKTKASSLPDPMTPELREAIDRRLARREEAKDRLERMHGDQD